MSRIIRVDLDVWNVIDRAKKPRESNSAALRRILGIEKESHKPKRRLS